MVYILIFVLLVLWMLALRYTKDVMSPPSILYISYIFACISTLIYSSLKNWEVEIHAFTAILIIASVAAFFATFILSRNLIYRNRQDYFSVKREEIHMGTYMLFLILSMVFLIIYLFAFSRKYSLSMNLDAFNQMMNSVKLSNYNSDVMVRRLPAWVTGLTKFTRAFSYISLYLFCSQVNTKKDTRVNNKRKWIYLFAVLLYVPIPLLEGGRWNLIVMLVSGLIMFYILYTKQCGFFIGVNISAYLQILVFVLFVFGVFTLSRGIVGRQSDANFIEYVSAHFGTSIQNFDMAIHNPIAPSNIWGKETFYSLHKLLYQLGIEKTFYMIHLEFRSKDGVSMGNVYTGLREYYYDFGIVGCVILMMLLGVIFARMYYRMRASECKQIDKKVIWYSIAFSLLFFHSFSGGFYKTFFSLDYVFLFLLINLTSFVLKKYDVRFKRKEKGIL